MPQYTLGYGFKYTDIELYIHSVMWCEMAELPAIVFPIKF